MGWGGGPVQNQWPTKRDMVEVLCVNPLSCTPCPEEEMGEIWVRGPQVPSGSRQQSLKAARDKGGVYLNDGTGPFLRTGDRGTWSGGRLFITERLEEFEANWFAEPNAPLIKATPWDVKFMAWIAMGAVSLLMWSGIIYLAGSILRSVIG